MSKKEEGTFDSFDELFEELEETVDKEKEEGKPKIKVKPKSKKKEPKKEETEVGPEEFFAEEESVESEAKVEKSKEKDKKKDEEFVADFLVEEKPKVKITKKKVVAKPKVKPKQAKLEEDFFEPSDETAERFKINLEGMASEKKEVWMYYADKGQGKTTFALSHPGKIAALSFDFKTALIKNTMFNNDSRIKVFDVMQYIDYSTAEAKLKTSETVLDFIFTLLDSIKKDGSFDWILIDGSEIFSKLGESVMRYRNNIAPYAGIGNLNIWKERRQYIQNLHYKSLSAVNKGVIYTTYPKWDEEIVEAQTIHKRKRPNWIDVIMTETDVVIYLDTDEKDDIKYIARVDSSKYSEVKSGVKIEITAEPGKVNCYNAILEASK